MVGGCEVSFPNIGITFSNLPSGFSVFGFTITFYGIIIACGMISGYLVSAWQAKRTGQDKDMYLDFAIWAIIFSLFCARLYYVIFTWEDYKDNLLQIFNLRGGGLAIYGGVIGGIISVIVYSKVKKKNMWLMMDTGCVGLITGQIIGRYGNFFNKEAFGGYSDGLFAMQLPWEEAVRHMSPDSAQALAEHVNNGMITVHPTFLYESVWNLVVLILILLYSKHKKFDGELLCLYIGGYGLGRAWIEGLRTDQLLLWNTGIPVSQLLAAIMVVAAIAGMVIGRKKGSLRPIELVSQKAEEKKSDAKES